MLANSKSYNRKKLLAISIFKNSNMWAKSILLHIHNIDRFNDTLYDNDDNKLDINFSFIDGLSTDGTFLTLVNYCNDNMSNVQIHRFEPDDVSNSTEDLCARYKKLAIIRNYAIKQSTKDLNFTDNDYILFVDSDIKFKYDTVHELIKDMESCKADIIAPMVYIENFREYGNYYFYDTLAFRSLNNEKFHHIRPYIANMNLKIPNEISSVGSFYLMRYDVAKKVKYTGEKDSENVEFCNSARSLGFRVFISPRLSVSHINFDEYGLEWH